jgi:eukaryotic-like serine/threonine-protein kinase
MEYAKGPNLDELVRGQSHHGLPLAAARQLLEQLFSALAAAHERGIVHRDLKPDNVRVSGDADAGFRMKVLDFGIAKDFGVGTLSGTTPGLGAPLWTAPEQAREGYRPVPSADVWSLGLLTFFVLTGRLYWRNAEEHASMADLAIELVKGDLEPATTRLSRLSAGRDGEPPGLPPGFDAWFARAVSRDPDQRFADARVAWAELAPLFEAPSPDRPALRVRPAGFLTAVILSCVAMGLVIYWLLRSMRV